jgi:hypothetical protein
VPPYARYRRTSSAVKWSLQNSGAPTPQPRVDWCELSHTECRKSPGAASAQSRSVSSAGLHSSSRIPEMPQCGLARC